MLKDNIQNLNSHLANITSSLNAQFAKSGGGSLEKIKLSEVADEIRKIELVPPSKEFYIVNRNSSYWIANTEIRNGSERGTLIYQQPTNVNPNLYPGSKISIGQIPKNYIGRDLYIQTMVARTDGLSGTATQYFNTLTLTQEDFIKYNAFVFVFNNANYPFAWGNV